MTESPVYTNYKSNVPMPSILKNILHSADNVKVAWTAILQVFTGSILQVVFALDISLELSGKRPGKFPSRLLSGDKTIT